MVSFHDTRLPSDVEKGAQGGPNFHTSILVLSSGYEKRNADWSRSRASYDVSYGIQSKENVHDVLEFFYARYGRLYGFRFKDWGDYELGKISLPGGEVETPQTIASGDGVTVAFQIFKRYTSGGFNFDRKITRPVDGTWNVYVNGVLQTYTTHYTINYSTGIITFVTPPATFATGTLTTTGQPSNGETITLNGKIYTFQTVLTNIDGNVLIGANTEATYDNLIAAVNLAAGAGTLYAANTTLHPTISASEGTGTDVLFTAKTAGTAGNALTTVEALTNASFANATLTGGTNGVITVSGEFDVPCRFDTDKINLSMETWSAGSVGSIQIVEIKE